MSRTFIADLLYRDGAFHVGEPVTVPGVGAGEETIRLDGRVLLPGLVNAHSHAFQRVIRGQTQQRSESEGNFWSWRDAMYRAANRLSPEDLFAIARMAFLEMALSGITTVGEFHYIHRDPQGRAYDDPNLIAKLTVQAAREVGLRVCLLRVAYARSGFGKDIDPLQRRFIEPRDEYLSNLETLKNTLDGEFAWACSAPHSVRAVSLDYLRELATWSDRAKIPLHMHVSEQPAELQACEAEYGTTPVALLAREEILGPRFTAVHGTHVSNDEIQRLADAHSTVCACPTTERDLGDGVVPAQLLRRAGVRMALGSDSQARIDLLEDARELEYHLRLQTLERGLLAPEDLFECATSGGAQSLAVPANAFDFFTLDLDDPSIAGAGIDNLVAAIVFGASRSAVRDVIVGGEFIVRDGQHSQGEEIVNRFRSLFKLPS